MRMKFIFITLLTTLLASSYVSGKILDKVVMKDGSVIEGHIVSQLPGKEIRFYSEKATVCVEMSLVANTMKTEVEVSKLPVEWQTWIADNPLSVRSDYGKKYIQMSRIFFTSNEAESDSVVVDTFDVKDPPVNMALLFARNFENHQVKIVERGSSIKFVDLTPLVCVLQFREMKSISKVLRQADVVTGMNDVIETRKGLSFHGQIVEQLLGKSIRLITDDGVTQVIENGDISVQKREKNNPNQDIFEQVPFLDIVAANHKEIEGIITYQNYGTKKEPAFMCVLDKNKKENRIAIKDITEMRRVKNPQYRQIKIIHIGKDEVYFNQHLIKPVKCEIDQKAQIFYFNKSLVSQHLILSADSIQSRLAVEMCNTLTDKSVMLIPVDEKMVSKKGTIRFSYQDLVTKSVPIVHSVISADEKFIRLEFAITIGNYILYNPKKSLAYFCEIR